MISTSRSSADQSPLPAAMDIVFIEGLRGDTVIGIHDGEFDTPQPVVIDVQAGVERAQACSSDRIGDTIDYSQLRLRLLRLLAEHRLQLLEAFAETVADVLIDEFGAAWVRVRVVKPNKFADTRSVGVQIERLGGAGRGLATHSPQTRGAAVLHLLGSGLVPPAQVSAG